MKILIFFILCLTSAVLAEDFKTVSGKEYKDATITRVEPDGLVLKYKSGISKVYFTELPKEIQERFHYAPAKAAQFNAAEQAAIAQSNAKAQQEADAKEKTLTEQRAKAAQAQQEQARREAQAEGQAQRQLPPRPIGDTMSRVGGGSGIGASSERFKDEIKPMGDASDAILALKPVTFRYKQELDPLRIPQFGLVAEEVEKVNPELVTHAADGKLFGVRYDAVNAMLLNEFLKEHRVVLEQGATIARQQKQIEALTAGLQKVSAQLEVSKSAPHTVVANE